MDIKNTNISKITTFLLFTIFFAIGVATFKDYGISVDEEFQRSNGFYWLNYVLSFTSFDDLLNEIMFYQSSTLHGWAYTQHNSFHP